MLNENVKITNVTVEFLRKILVREKWNLKLHPASRLDSVTRD